MKVRAAAYCSQTAFKCSLFLLLFFLLGVLPGYGQTSHTAIARHDQELKKSLKEAAKVDAAYKDTHLNTDAYTFRKGEAGRKRLRSNERAQYQFNVKGDAAKKLRLFKKKRHRQRKTKLFN